MTDSIVEQEAEPLSDSERLTQIIESIDWTETPEAVVQYLKWAATFTDYSAFNKMLIKAQMPEATRIAAAGSWRKKGRKIIKGETHRIRIYQPNRKRRYLNGDDNPDDFRNVKTTQSEDGKILRYIEWTTYRSFAAFDISQTEPFDGEEDNLPDLVPECLDMDGATLALERIREEIAKVRKATPETRLARVAIPSIAPINVGHASTEDYRDTFAELQSALADAMVHQDLPSKNLNALHVRIFFRVSLLAAAMIYVKNGLEIEQFLGNVLTAMDSESVNGFDCESLLRGRNAMSVVRDAESLATSYEMILEGTPFDWAIASI